LAMFGDGVCGSGAAGDCGGSRADKSPETGAELRSDGAGHGVVLLDDMRDTILFPNYSKGIGMRPAI